MRRPRPLEALALLALLVVVAPGCANHDVEGRRVLVVGDSLLAQSDAAVERALQADGWQATVAGIPGSTIEGWQPLLPRVVGSEQPDVAVIELGTNDCAVTTCRALGAYIDRAMHELTGRVDVVYWLNTRRVPANHPVHPDYVNREIADAAVRWPNLVVVDMDGWFEDHPDWTGPDGLHFTDAGEQQLGELIRSAIHDSSPAARAGAGS